MPPDRPSFRIWIRRTVDPDTTYTIQFTLVGARGLLAVARPGGTMESPAAIQGIETFLSSEEIRGTRFVVSPAPGRIEEYLLVGLGDGLLERMPEGYWVPLVPRTAGTIRLLLPRIPSPVDANRSDASEMPHTQPISRPDVRRALRDALAKAAGHVWDRAKGEPDALSTRSPDGQPVIVERTPEPPSKAPMEVEEDVVVFLGEESEDEARQGPVGHFSFHEVENTDPMAERPRIPLDLEPPPPASETGGFGARVSSLVKFLRREQERDRAEISRLRDRIAELESEQVASAESSGTSRRREPSR